MVKSPSFNVRERQIGPSGMNVLVLAIQFSTLLTSGLIIFEKQNIIRFKNNVDYIFNEPSNNNRGP